LSPKFQAYEPIVNPSESEDPDASNEQLRSVHEYVNDATGAALSAPPPPPPLPATSTGLKTVVLLTSSSRSLIPSPESSVQLVFPELMTWLYSAWTSLEFPGLVLLASSANAPAACGDAIEVPEMVPYSPCSIG
jgi:hypothetical protein